MPNRNEKNPGNVAGRFYVDNSCIDCDMCREFVPAFFRLNDEIGLSIVFRQPVTAEELKEASEAMEACPTDSIGSDGGDV